MRFRIATVIMLAIGLYACATADGKKTEKVRYSRDQINAAEIKTFNASNAHELIKTLRPNWLRGVGVSSFKYNAVAYPIVYIDEIKMGEMDHLGSISTINILKIEHINGSETALRLGRGHHGGVILITTK